MKKGGKKTLAFLFSSLFLPSASSSATSERPPSLPQVRRVACSRGEGKSEQQARERERTQTQLRFFLDVGEGTLSRSLPLSSVSAAKPSKQAVVLVVPERRERRRRSWSSLSH